MTPLEGVVLDRIRSEGPMPFAAYMQLALYHPRHGYYGSGAPRTGWGGHFVTSSELDPAYAQLWLRGVEQIWIALERPAPFEIVEVGPGEGGFAHAFLSALAGCDALAAAASYRLVERVPAVAERQRAKLDGFGRVSWSRSLPEVPRAPAGCVLANEVLDNLPVHLVEMRGGELLELCVGAGADGLELVARAPSSPHLQAFLARLGVELPESHRFEVPLAAEALIARAASAFERVGLILVDYGDDAQALARHPRGSLVCYSGPVADDDPLDAPGSKDITCHVNWTAVTARCRAAGLDVHGPVRQTEVLRALGLGDLDAGLRAEHTTALAKGQGTRAVRALSRRQALGALADPGGLGSLDVVVGLRPPGRLDFMSPDIAEGR
ncbi:MAG: class I SAM-dependent methyltransferase [Actinomycetota bacterium]